MKRSPDFHIDPIPKTAYLHLNLMKTQLITCLLLLLVSRAFAQIPPAGCYPVQAWATAHCAMPTDSGGLVLGCGGFYADTIAALFKVDAQGKWVSRTVAPGTYGAAIVMAMPLSDGGSLTVTRYVMCDLGSPDSLHRYWPDGSLRWAFGSSIQYVLELEDSNLFIYPGMLDFDGLMLNPDGTEVGSFHGESLPYPIRGMSAGNYRDFFVAGEDRIIAMRENQSPWTDPWEYLAWESAFRFPITDLLRVKVDTFLVSGEQMLYRMDSAMLLMDSLDLASEFDSIAHLAMDASGYYLHGLGPGGINRVAKVGNDLALRWVSDFPASVEVTNLLRTDSALVAYGNHTFGRYPGGNFSQQPVTIYLDPIDGSHPGFAQDVEVLGLSVSNIEQMGTSLRLDAVLILRNNGPDTLRSLGITSYSQEVAMWCDYKKRHSLLEGLLIPPGDTLHYPVDSLVMYYVLHPITYVLMVKNVCISVSGPNFLAEENIDNNVGCATISYVGTEDAQNHLGLRVSPNPFSEVLNIEVDAVDGATYELISPLGKNLQSGRLADGLNHVFLDQAVSCGPMLLRISTANGGQVVKTLVRMD
jgi:hypothetical protein